MASVLPRPEQAPDLVPRKGGPVWRAAGDVRTLSTAGYALVLQVAHPTVGAGVLEHSDFRRDPWGRLLRTLDYVHGSIYGGPEMAATIGRRVREMHRSIKGVKPDGSRYHALEPDAYAWVHATLASAIVDGQRVFGKALSVADVEEFWREWLRFGRLIGVRESDLPDDWAGFRAYFDRVVAEELEDNETVHIVLDTLAEPKQPPVPGLHPAVWRAARVPAARGLHLATVGLLPAPLRARMRLEWRARDDRAFRALAAASRMSTPLMLGPLGEFGPYYVRWRRKALARGDVASVRPSEREARDGATAAA